jgi:malonate-semialdehyde dehydrogenase (acetylating)/methylmalonate-semialdehyde dehydrogenase
MPTSGLGLMPPSTPGTLLPAPKRVWPEMTVYTDEIFGPVLSVVRVETYDEGIELIASNQWGNGAAIFTCDGGAARQFVFDADPGMIGVNVPIPVPVGYYSFGGWGESLFGDTHMYGPEGSDSGPGTRL